MTKTKTEHEVLNSVVYRQMKLSVGELTPEQKKK